MIASRHNGRLASMSRQLIKPRRVLRNVWCRDRHLKRYVCRAEQKGEDMQLELTKRLDRNTARILLKAWKQAGAADDPQILKKMMKQRGAEQSAVAFRQLAVDGASALIAWYSATALSESKAQQIPAEFLLYTLALYLTMNATLDVVQLITIGVATRKYANESAVILQAVRELANVDSDPFGVAVVDKARRAVNTVEVLKSLDLILEALKKDVFRGNGKEDGDFYRDLGAYLVLARAQEEYGVGFLEEFPGIDKRTIAEIAAEFALADRNDDGFIDWIEFKALVNKVRPAEDDMDEASVRAAVDMLDTNGDGVVDFREFVSWFIAKNS